MNHRNPLLLWLFSGGFIAFFSAIFGMPVGVRATPFASPTPAATTINQPYVTFQNQKMAQRLFRFNDGVPVYVVILILLVLLGLVALYLTSFRPKH